MSRLLIIAAFFAATAADADNGALYGKVLLDGGREVHGAIRWGNSNPKLYWLHHLNGRRAEPYDISDLDDDVVDAILDSQPGPSIDVNGTTIEFVKWFSKAEIRPGMFDVEFGAISSITFDHSLATIQLVDGGTIVAERRSRDMDADITVLLEDGSRREYDDDELREIHFSAAPLEHPAFPAFIYGSVDSTLGPWAGLIEWDSDEREADDELDGDVDEDELSIDFGDIVSIETVDESASRVVTKDGIERVLTGSNDVNSENRGIVVHHPDHGSVTLNWEVFKKVTFEPLPSDFLPRRSVWSNTGRVSGAVVTDQTRLQGNVIMDINLEFAAEAIVARNQDFRRASIPLRLVRAIHREGDGKARVELTSGRQFTFDTGHPLAAGGSGILIASEAGANYVAAGDVKSILIE